MIFYEGPSMLDGKPIVAIATTKTSNRKTGDMIQTWILRRRVDPVRAVATGGDASICGSCYHRGSSDRPRTCYVNVGQAPLTVYHAYKRGIYERGPLPSHKPVRMGSYGDPVAVPIEAWTASKPTSWTGYTHQWRNPIAEPFRSWLMASCETVADAAEAARMGWRTFLTSWDEVERSIECPATTHHGTQCADCRLCRGSSISAPSIFIRPHGTAAAYV